MTMIGAMAMPVNFRYRDVFLKGKPRHNLYDRFLIRHPRMDVGRRAKIFAPYDALKGFDEVVESKDVQYVCKIVLSPEDEEELSRKLEILHNLTFNSRIARANHVQVAVIFYEACSDENHEAYGVKGQYKTITGTCWNVDTEMTQTILIDSTRISLTNVIGINGRDGLFSHYKQEDCEEI